eukprot:gene13392-13519_t
MQHQDFVILCYVVGTFLAVAFAGYAFWYGWYLSKKAQNKDTEAFVTARGSQNIWRIGWSFYAGAVGAWVIVAPPQYAQFSGIVGVVVYAIATGIPILLIGFFGHIVTRDMPHVFSISDFVGWRFGPVAKLIVFLVCMFNMSIALLAEYTTIGAIFSDFVGSVSYAIIIIIGVLTLLYTAYGVVSGAAPPRFGSLINLAHKEHWTHAAVLGRSASPTRLGDKWVDVLVVLLAIIMNEGAVDSLQNGLAASISGHFLKNSPLKWTRLAVILLNVPLVIIATQGFAVLSLFLVGNLLTCCAIFPLIAGLIPRLRHLVSETGFVLSCVGGVLTVTASGIGLQWTPGDPATSLSYGAFWAWYDNYYDWRQFVAALAGSLGTLLLWCLGSWFVRRSTGFKGPGVSGILMKIPGMKYLTATPHWPQLEHPKPSLPTWKDADQAPGRDSTTGVSIRPTGMQSTDGVILCDGSAASAHKVAQ